jgi:hypothetical protein
MLWVGVRFTKNTVTLRKSSWNLLWLQNEANRYDSTLMKITPQYIFGEKFWAFVLCSYLFQGTVCAFVYWNYRKVYALRRAYFNSHDYQSSLHSRTLLVMKTRIGVEIITDKSTAYSHSGLSENGRRYCRAG